MLLRLPSIATEPGSLEIARINTHTTVDLAAAATISDPARFLSAACWAAGIANGSHEAASRAARRQLPASQRWIAACAVPCRLGLARKAAQLASGCGAAWRTIDASSRADAACGQGRSRRRDRASLLQPGLPSGDRQGIYHRHQHPHHHSAGLSGLPAAASAQGVARQAGAPPIWGPGSCHPTHILTATDCTGCRTFSDPRTGSVFELAPGVLPERDKDVSDSACIPPRRLSPHHPACACVHAQHPPCAACTHAGRAGVPCAELHPLASAGRRARHAPAHPGGPHRRLPAADVCV